MSFFIPADGNPEYIHSFNYPCPRCGEAMIGLKVIFKVLEGITLECRACSFQGSIQHDLLKNPQRRTKAG